MVGRLQPHHHRSLKHHLQHLNSLLAFHKTLILHFAMVDAVSNRITTVYRSTTSNNNKRKLDQVASFESSSTTSSSRRTEPNGPLPPTPIQFFVRSFPRGKTQVIQAHSTDSVEFIHDKIKSIT
ncbi:hypothetical protein HAX54_028533, partial [Datura stramonium]|nr:hypothetical protein [Datura stramonium]